MKTKIIFFTTLMVISSFASIKGQIVQKQVICQNENDEDPIFNIPDLTVDQKQKIETLHIQLMKDQLSIQNQINEKQAHLQTLSTVDKSDINAINKTIDEIYLLKAAKAKKGAAFTQDVRNILSDKQRITFDTRPQFKNKRVEINLRKNSKRFDDDLNRGTPGYDKIEME